MPKGANPDLVRYDAEKEKALARSAGPIRAEKADFRRHFFAAHRCSDNFLSPRLAANP